MTIYGKIKQLWEQSGSDLTKPPHLQSLETEARQLDDRLGEIFKPCIQQWEEGLISASELLEKLVYESCTEV